MNRRVLILAGGGGHTGYAYSLAQSLHGKASLSFLVPEGDTLSARRLSKFGDVDFLLKSRGPKTPTHEFAVRLTMAFAYSLGKVSRKFDATVSTGSNFCIPPAATSWFKGIPIINIESSVRFTKASRAAFLLQPFSRITALQWKEQKRLLNGVVVGPIFPKPEVKPWNGGYILVTGGTYGHKLLFDTLQESDLTNVVLQTGRIDLSPYRKRHPEWKFITYTEKFQELLAGAEIVVTHFGSTVLEAAAYRKPVVLVLNPEWRRTVGLEDAQRLAGKVNAVMISKINLESIMQAIATAKKRSVAVLPNGAQNLADQMLQMLNK